MATDIEKAPAALQELVAEADTGRREPTGLARQLVFGTALAWSLFQLWYASPLPFVLRFGVLNDTEARSIHLAFALFLAFLAWPAFKGSPRERIPLLDWVLALAGAFAGGYLLLFYAQLATRPGQPTPMDIVVASAGIAAAAGGHAPRGRLADGRAGAAVPGLLHARAVHARGDVAQGRQPEPAAVAHVAHHRRRVRHRAGRVDQRDLRLRAVRRAARPRRRRQLHDAGQLRGAGPPARRAGQGGGGVVGAERHDQRQLGQQRGLAAASSPSR